MLNTIKIVKKSKF